jgi:hypothetical protein
MSKIDSAICDIYVEIWCSKYFNHFVIQLSFDGDIFVPPKTSSMLVFWVNFRCLKTNVFVTYYSMVETPPEVYLMYFIRFSSFLPPSKVEIWTMRCQN